MLIIHPSDRTTDYLRPLYEDRTGITCLRGEESRNRLAQLLYHLPGNEQLMLLGHGCQEGLYRLEDGVYKCYVGRSMAYSLRRHYIIGIFCHANVFASQMNLHGLFSGMVISEMAEAELYNISTTEKELEYENALYVSNLKSLLTAGIPYHEIPARFKELVEDGPELRKFNYNSLYEKNW